MPSTSMHWKTLLLPQRVGSTTDKSENPVRSPFEKDCDRIIFSHPFRKLQDKTQVHSLSEHDFVHTRLTHSLEVSSVGRSLGKKVGETILQNYATEVNSSFSSSDMGAIVAAAALAHDLGNPPFGHAGEDGISDFFTHHPQGKEFKQQNITLNEWQDLISFEGNAQGFRILNNNKSQGLELTYSTLGAFIKYPCSATNARDKSKKSQSKYGVFQTEMEIFTDVVTRLDLQKVGDHIWTRHPLAFLVEAADDICYNIIDLEDACRLGLVSFAETLMLFKELLENQFKQKKLDTLRSVNEKVGMLRALAINKLINECTEVFLTNEKAMLTGAFDASLIDSCQSSKALAQIKKISQEKIYRNRNSMEIQASGYAALSGLLEEFTLAGKYFIEKKIANKYQNLIDLLPIEIQVEIKKLNQDQPYEMLRNIIDFISGMTDRYAFLLYRKIKGFAP